MAKLKLGAKAPEIILPDQNGKMHKLSDIKGSWVLVYFYPKDDTTGCTIEACGIRDIFPKFKKMRAIVFGISADSVKSHKKFEEKFKLPFTLLADEKKETLDDYGVWQEKKFMGRKYMGIVRTSFLIDPRGTIVKIYENVKPKDHPGEVLADLQSLQR